MMSSSFNAQGKAPRKLGLGWTLGGGIVQWCSSSAAVVHDGKGFTENGLCGVQLRYSFYGNTQLFG